MIRISAVICSHNRLHYLPGSIGSLARQDLPPDQFEIILVDNASTDGTGVWAQEQGPALARFVYIHEPALGLSNARNTAWRAAKGEIVAFLDDDAIAAPDWLSKILEKFQHADSRLAVVGGKVEALWESPPPEWLVPEMWSHLAVVDWSGSDMVLVEPHFFVGANMAIRKSALEQVGGFNSLLGRKGKKLLSNEEIHLKRQLEEAGFYALYAPEVFVRHSIPAERMTPEWFFRRYYWQGVSDSAMQQVVSPRARGFVPWLRSCVRNLRSTRALVTRWYRHRLSRRGRNRSIAVKCLDYYHWGRLAEDWRNCIDFGDVSTGGKQGYSA